MKAEYTSQELRRLPGVTYDTLRTWAGRRNSDEKRKGDKKQPVLLLPLRKPGNTHCWVYGSDAVERIWRIRMLQMLGYKNEQIERILNASDHGHGEQIWDTLNDRINDLGWKIRYLSIAQRFAEITRSVGKLPEFPHKEGVDDIDRYLEVLPVAPKIASYDYETGSKELLKAHGIDKDAVIAQSQKPNLLDTRDKIYQSIKELWLRQKPASSSQVCSLVHALYTELYEKQGYSLDIFHSTGELLATAGQVSQIINDKYGDRFSVFLSEAIFIYCYIQQMTSEDDEQSEE